MLASWSHAAMAQVNVGDFSFEFPDVSAPPGYVYGPKVPGLTFVGGAGITANNTAWGFQPAPEGKQVAFLQNISQIMQPVSGLMPGGNYVLRFYTAKRHFYPATEVTVAFNGVTILKVTPAGDSWQQVTSRAFTAAYPNGTLSFSTNAQPDVGAGIDAVTIEPLSAAAADASFEAPDVGTGAPVAPAAPGVTFTARAGITANGALGFPAAPNGKQAGFLYTSDAGAPAITQTLSGLTPGASYMLRFHLAHAAGAAQTITVAFNQRTIGTISTGSQQFFPYLVGPFAAPGDGSASTLTFTGTTGPIGAGRSAIDWVTLIPVLPATVASPSFEAPTAQSRQGVLPVGVTFSNGAGLLSNGDIWGFPPAPDGLQSVFLQTSPNGPPTVVQAVSGLTPGVAYRVHFYLTARPGWPSANPIAVAINGTPLDTFTPPMPAGNVFVAVATRWFVADASNATISFTGTSPAGQDISSAIDRVAVVPAPRMPEP
jgi:hypothetical protein